MYICLYVYMCKYNTYSHPHAPTITHTLTHNATLALSGTSRFSRVEVGSRQATHGGSASRPERETGTRSTPRSPCILYSRDEAAAEAGTRPGRGSMKPCAGATRSRNATNAAISREPCKVIKFVGV